MIEGTGRLAQTRARAMKKREEEREQRTMTDNRAGAEKNDSIHFFGMTAGLASGVLEGDE